jgi:flagellar protein FlaG
MSLNTISPSIDVAGGSLGGNTSPETVDSGNTLPDAEEAILSGEATTSGGEDVVQALDAIRSAVQLVRRNLEFSFNEEADMTVVTVTDTETGEVIRQIPSEEVVKLSAYFNETSSLLFSEKV